MRPLTETGKLSPGSTASALFSKAVQREDAFGFVTDVEEDGVGGEGGDGGVDLLLAGFADGGVALLVLLEEVFELFGVVSGASTNSVGAGVSRDSGAVGLVVSGVFGIEMDCSHFCIKEWWGASLLCFVMVLGVGLGERLFGRVVPTEDG